MPRIVIVMLVALAASTVPQPSPAQRATSCSNNISGDTTVYTPDDVEVTEKPRLRSHPPLQYPRTALRDDLTGAVLVSVIVNANGSTDPASIHLSKSLRLDVDSAAIRMVIGSVYWPACRGSEAVRIRVQQPVAFGISEKSAVAQVMEQSPYVPVKVESCVIADSLLGPLAKEGAVVRGYYLADMDSTRLVAGPLVTGDMPSQRRPWLGVSTSYGGHKPTTYPHADVIVTIFGPDAARLSSNSPAPVVLILDESPYPLDSVPFKPSSPSPFGQVVYVNLKVPPNLFFALTNAKQAAFLVGKVRASLSSDELRDVRGLYRVALCGLAAN